LPTTTNPPLPPNAPTWDYFDGDHSATLETYSAPRRIVWAHEDSDRPHISLNR
jgi:NADH dehydrogenase